jgi:adenylate kinase family enzyme
MGSTNFIFINGKGSSGKDTQADILKEKIGTTAIKLSTGDIYREAKAGTGEYGKYHDQIAPFIAEVDKNGGLVSDEVIFGIVKIIIIDKISEGKETFIFTGFPRTIGQLELIDRLVGSLEEADAIHLHYDISDETSRERAGFRRQKAEDLGIPIRPDDEEEVVERSHASHS